VAERHSYDALRPGFIANPNLRVAPYPLNVAGGIDSVEERVLLVDVSAVGRMVEADHPAPASTMTAHFEPHQFHERRAPRSTTFTVDNSFCPTPSADAWLTMRNLKAGYVVAIEGLLLLRKFVLGEIVTFVGFGAI
jgi:hypothetical protein